MKVAKQIALLSRKMGHGCSPDEDFNPETIEELHKEMHKIYEGAEEDDFLMWWGGLTHLGVYKIEWRTGSGRMRIEASDTHVTFDLYTPEWGNGENPMFSLFVSATTNEINLDLPSAESLERLISGEDDAGQKIRRMSNLASYIAPVICGLGGKFHTKPSDLAVLKDVSEKLTQYILCEAAKRLELIRRGSNEYAFNSKWLCTYSSEVHALAEMLGNMEEGVK